MAYSSFRKSWLLLLGCSLSLWSSALKAAQFNINPIKLQLSDSAPSTLLSINNTSPNTARFQISVFAWAQNRQGEVQLEPTEDIVFFPVMLTAGPNEQRNIRIGITKPITDVEKTYRIIVREIPEAPTKDNKKIQINLLTEISVPIFVLKGKAVPAAKVRLARAQDNTLVLALENIGNAHFSYENFAVTLLDKQDKELMTYVKDNGWYILAGGGYDLVVEVPEDLRPLVAKAAVKVKAEGLRIEQQLDIPPVIVKEEAPAVPSTANSGQVVDTAPVVNSGPMVTSGQMPLKEGLK